MTKMGTTLFCLVVCASPLAAATPAEDLWTAARQGNVAALKAILAKGADVNAKTPYGATALSFAADKGHVAIVKVLLEHKADVNVKDTFYDATPLKWAIAKDHGKIVELLVEAGADKADDALIYAARKSNLDLARTIL